jgi:hypothetical protein
MRLEDGLFGRFLAPGFCFVSYTHAALSARDGRGRPFADVDHGDREQGTDCLHETGMTT